MLDLAFVILIFFLGSFFKLFLFLILSFNVLFFLFGFC
jgi:hypothetical protein